MHLENERARRTWVARPLPLWTRPHAFENTRQPHVIAVPNLARLALCLIFAAACSGDAAGSPRKAVAGKTTVQTESGGEVVIPAASTPYTVAPVAVNASVTGTVTFARSIDPLPAADAGADAALCGLSIADESVRVQGDGGVAGVVVWLEGVTTGKAPGLERRVELENDRCRLVPRVQAAMVGSAVNVITHDDFRQHLRFTAGGDTAPRASIQLGGGEQVIPTELPFKRAGMVIVSDTAHAWAKAYLAVFDHPYFAVTSVSGSFSIDSVPPGKYTLHAWHERTKVAEQAVEVTGGGALKLAIALEP